MSQQQQQDQQQPQQQQQEPTSPYSLYKGRVKFKARPSQNQSGFMDMVVDLDNGRTEKVFAPADQDWISKYEKGDRIILVKAPNPNGGAYVVVPEQPEGTGRFSEMSRQELQNASLLANQHVQVIREMYRQMLGVEELEGEHMDKETARSLATTAFIQTFR